MQTLSQSASRITMLLGPVLAGVLIGFIGAASVLMVDAVTYLVAVVLVAGFVPAGRRAPVPGEERGSRAGIRFVLRDPLLRWWMPVFTIGDAAWMAIFVALPVLTVQRYDSDPRIAGWLFASFGVGAIVGNIVAFRLLDRTDGLRLIGLGILGQALPLWLLVLELPASLVSVTLMLSGLANGLVNPSIHAILTLRAPPAIRANVMAVVMTLFALVTPIGLLGAGPLLDAFSLELVFGLCAAIQTVTMTGAAIAAFRARSATGASPSSSFAFAQQSRKAGLQEVVCRGGAERPGEQSPEPRRKHLGRDERRRAPGAEAPRARDELPDGALETRAGRLLVLAGVRIALDERLAHEAADPLSRERPRDLEGRRRERRKLERGARRRTPRE